MSVSPPSTRTVIDEILRREGSEYVNNPLDRGGPTRRGITLATLQRHVPGATFDDVRNLTEEAARDIYEMDYVRLPGFNLLEEPLRGLLVDFGVTSGPKTAIRALQTAVGARLDAVLGPDTRELLQRRPADEVYASVLRQYLMHFATIVAHDASQLVFLRGWISRASEFVR